MDSNLLVIGIDPGLSGAVAGIGGAAPWVIDLPVVGERIFFAMLVDTLASLVPSRHTCHVFLEKAQAMPGGKQGVQGMFKYGVNYGLILGALSAQNLPYIEVHPSIWKRRLGLTKDKEQSRARAIQLFPTLAHALARKKDSDRAEALLLASYGRMYALKKEAYEGQQTHN